MYLLKTRNSYQTYDLPGSSGGILYLPMAPFIAVSRAFFMKKDNTAKGICC